jgi:methionine-S-sulfoxide reductase
MIAASVPAAAPEPVRAAATFAGGCFWCMEGPFEELRGVISVTSGYTGGHKKNPTYEEVLPAHRHAEAVQIVYDPQKVSYEKLLDVFWRNVDPVTPNAQFCDHGDQYRSAIFFGEESGRPPRLQAADRGLGPVSAEARHRDRGGPTFCPAEGTIRTSTRRTSCAIGLSGRLWATSASELWGGGERTREDAYPLADRLRPRWRGGSRSAPAAPQTGAASATEERMVWTSKPSLKSCANA